MQISGNNKKLNKFILHLQKKINQISISNFNKKLFIIIGKVSGNKI